MMRVVQQCFYKGCKERGARDIYLGGIGLEFCEVHFLRFMFTIISELKKTHKEFFNNYFDKK